MMTLFAVGTAEEEILLVSAHAGAQQSRIAASAAIATSVIRAGTASDEEDRHEDKGNRNRASGEHGSFNESGPYMLRARDGCGISLIVRFVAVGGVGKGQGHRRFLRFFSNLSMMPNAGLAFNRG